MIDIIEASDDHFDEIWAIFSDVVAAGDTYGYSLDTTKEQAHVLWTQQPQKTFVAIREGVVLGTYFLKPNQYGPGQHVCNCGYMVSASARGLGLATLMCEHSQQQAVDLGYQAMQFNYVAASNEAAVYLWNKLGFDTVGRLPKAFRHPKLGLVDALVMYKWLVDGGLN